MDCGMQRDDEALFSLLRAGLWEQGLPEQGLFPLSESDWESVFRKAGRQTVTGIVFRGILQLPDALMPPTLHLVRWVAATDAIERRNRRMNRVLAELGTVFRRCRLHPVLQKGQGVAVYYEHPLLRECGDIDFYFPGMRACEEAVAEVQRMGCRVRRAADRSATYRWRGVDIEHHVRLVDLNSPSVQGYLRGLERDGGLRRVDLLPGSGISFTVPAPALNLLLLNAHILKHALGWGIGLRQLCDMARACHCLHDEVDPETMRTVCRKAGIEKWSRLLHAFLTEHLGLPVGELPYPEVGRTSQPLLDIVLRGGNFGQYVAGRSRSCQPAWTRRVLTSGSFVRNFFFSCRYAPKEAFWTFENLLKGQFQ